MLAVQLQARLKQPQQQLKIGAHKSKAGQYQAHACTADQF